MRLAILLLSALPALSLACPKYDTVVSKLKNKYGESQLFYGALKALPRYGVVGVELWVNPITGTWSAIRTWGGDSAETATCAGIIEAGKSAKIGGNQPTVTPAGI